MKAASAQRTCRVNVVARPGLTKACVTNRSSPRPTSWRQARQRARPVRASPTAYELGRVLKCVIDNWMGRVGVGVGGGRVCVEVNDMVRLGIKHDIMWVWVGLWASESVGRSKGDGVGQTAVAAHCSGADANLCALWASC